MRREDLQELHFIAPISNLASICKLGIECHNLASKIQHKSVAMEAVQQRRKNKEIPGAGKLHDYVNLYICARNPMLYFLKDKHYEICVIQVSPLVLDLPGVIIADGNASSDWVRFEPSPQGLEYINEELVFAHSWKHPEDQIAEWRHKTAKCAEVLVPNLVEPRFFVGVYICDITVGSKIQASGVTLNYTVNNYLFFR